MASDEIKGKLMDEEILIGKEIVLIPDQEKQEVDRGKENAPRLASPWKSSGMFNYVINRQFLSQGPHSTHFKAYGPGTANLLGRVTIVRINLANGDAWINLDIHASSQFIDEILKVILEYLFKGLGMRRVSAVLAEDQTEFLQQYLNNGFQIEGHIRQPASDHQGTHPLIYLGVLETEWQPLK